MSGPLNHSPAQIVRALLKALNVVNDPPAPGGSMPVWPCYASDEPGNPDEVVTVYDVPGLDSGRTNPDGERQEYHGFQIRIRARNHKTGYVKARALALAMDQVYFNDVTLDGTVYEIWDIIRKGDVIALNKDAPSTQRRLFTINAVVVVNIKPH